MQNRVEEGKDPIPADEILELLSGYTKVRPMVKYRTQGFST